MRAPEYGFGWGSNPTPLFRCAGVAKVVDAPTLEVGDLGRSCEFNSRRPHCPHRPGAGIYYSDILTHAQRLHT